MQLELQPNLVWRPSAQLESMVKQKLDSIKSARGSVISLQVLKSLEAELDESLWSRKLLLREFREKRLEPLFKKYLYRIQNSVFVMLILWCILDSGLQIATAFLTGLSASFTTLYFPAISLILYFCFLIISCNESVFTHYQNLPFITSIGVCVLLLTQEYGAFAIDCLDDNVQKCHFFPDQPRLSNAFQLILVVYFLPPLREKYQAVLVGSLILVLEVVVSIWLLDVPPVKIIPHVILYLMLNLMGLLKLYLDEIMQRRFFLDQRGWVETTLNLKFQKEQEERLMLSIIPKYMVAKLRPTIRMAIEKSDLGQPASNYGVFHDLYVSTQTDVSILFADIVNFTPLTETLDVAKLVELLNELFGRFDETAEHRQCLRIKIIGDCYYCVCGIPDPIEDHAFHCVKMGFDMINIIRDIREERNLNIDMRIGINSGNILCGLIGMKKWQYDIWSRDVTIANLMEQSGKPGRVHISKATKDKLDDSFQFEKGHGELRNKSLKEWGIETYFVVVPTREDDEVTDRRYSMRPQLKQSRNSIAPIYKLRELKKLTSGSHLHARRNTLLDQSLEYQRKLIVQINLHMDAAIDQMALSKKQQWFNSIEINPIFLTFRNFTQEIPYWNQPDPLFKYSIIGTTLLFFTLVLMTLVGYSSLGRYKILHATSCVIFIMFFLGGYAGWYNFIRQYWKNKYLENVSDFTNIGFHGKLKIISKAINSKIVLRLVIWFLFGFSLLSWTVLAGYYTMVDFPDGTLTNTSRNESMFHNIEKLNGSLPGNNHNFTNIRSRDYTDQPIIITFCFALVMVAFSEFLKINYFLKFLMKTFVITVFVLMVEFMWSHKNCLFWSSHFFHEELCDFSYVEHILFLVQIFLLLHIENRQVEYLSKLNYLWRRKRETEQKETAIIDLVNKTLLLNILPFHVAQRYFSQTMSPDHLYHETYDEVAVMFAAISNYMDFYAENQMNSYGKNCLTVLNEIILQFDQLLSEARFVRIEKIKMVGSTYMAAAGLQPGCRGSRPDDESEETERLDAGTNLEMLVNLATAMMEKLEVLNDDALQEFQLRIGIDCGKVIAGVVGAQKPLYDIWGNTVNVASRMESTGEMGKIQVTQKTAEILMTKRFKCDCRGKIFVKGKGSLVTYFVRTQFDPEATQL